MTSTHSAVEKELQSIKKTSDAPMTELAKQKLDTVTPTTVAKTMPKLRVSPDDMKLLNKNHAGPQSILNDIDQAVDTLKEYVAKAQKRVCDLEVTIRTAKPTDDSIVKEYTHSISAFFSMSDDSIKLTNDKIRIVTKAIGDILEMKTSLGNCNEFTIENIYDPQHPIASLHYFLLILISEHSDILKNALINMNKRHLGESLGSTINNLLEKPLKIAAEYSYSGDLEKKLSALTKSLTLTYPEQASAAKKALETVMLQDAKDTFIPSHIKRLDNYIIETSSQLSKTDTDSSKPANLTGKKLKLAIDLRAQLKYLTKESKIYDPNAKNDQPAMELQQIVACLLDFATKHNELTSEVLSETVNTYLGSTVGNWINYLFGSIISPASKKAYSGRLGEELTTTINSLTAQFPDVVEAAKNQALKVR